MAYPSSTVSSSISLLMEEEFQESNVVFSDHDLRLFSGHEDGHSFTFRDFILLPEQNKNEKKNAAISGPVNIPQRLFRCREECGDGSMEPPHLIVERRLAGKMAFSVRSGNGRTLKGRELSEVRNAILRLTGFLET